MMASRRPSISRYVTGVLWPTPTSVRGTEKCLASEGRAVPLEKAVGAEAPHMRRT